ncbi:hypothetical protein [Croceimicrobium hydrocarbonivorans]|uniref:Uncharacterized protein n=1 Tax=Croceimicrobium hydrocarbonivorans TaxID=2761580 RepID=A0A7H0VD40_9FLAO|nr:hypothetical protein [Croceimicrobium hydrocarbonivorans]QNR23638.1 hypothetical protein H4K34_14825 [Croceimicrobium hydrocarbonivorans]
MKQDKIVISVDKLYYSFNTFSDILNEDILNIFILGGYQIKDPTQQIDQNYKIQKIIIKNDIELGTLCLDSRYKPNLNTIKFFNKPLYTNRKQVIALTSFIDLNFNKDNYISQLELAIDTNYNIIKRYNRLINNNNLELTKNYIGSYYGIEYTSNTYKRSENNESKYILHKSDDFKSDIKTAKKPLIRLENKRKLLKNSQKRHYITDHLSCQGIDTGKDFFRMELVIPNHQSFLVSKNKEYINGSKSISSYQYNKINDMEKMEYMAVTSNGYYDINIDCILNNSDYKLSLFYIYLNKIIVNNDKLLKINYSFMPISKIKNISKKRNPKQVEEFDPIEKAQQGYLEMLQRLGHLTTDNIYQIQRMINKNKRDVNKPQTEIGLQSLFT